MSQLQLRVDLSSAVKLSPAKRRARRRSYASSMHALSGREQLALVDRLRESILAMPDRERSAPGGSPWDLARRRLADHIRDADPRGFLRWPEVRSTMFVANSKYASVELHALMSHPAWQQRWRPLLAEDPCGCPTPSSLVPDASDNLIHHAYHVLAIEERLGSIGDFDEIVELGGGYGSFLRLIRRLGVAARYHICDFPEFAALQQYYIASVALHRGQPAIREDVTWGSSTDQLPAERAPSRLFVGLWSLSEMPARDREPWYDAIAECDGVVIAFQRQFENVDNNAWFDELQRRITFACDCWEIPHMRGSFYLMGRRR